MESTVSSENQATQYTTRFILILPANKHCFPLIPEREFPSSSIPTALTSTQLRPTIPKSQVKEKALHSKTEMHNLHQMKISHKLKRAPTTWVTPNNLKALLNFRTFPCVSLC